MREKQGDYDRAFAAFATGNRLRRDRLFNPEDGPSPIAIAPPWAHTRGQPPDAIAQQHASWIAATKPLP